MTNIVSLAQGDLRLELCPSVGGSVAAFYATKDGSRIDIFRPYDSTLPLAPLYMASFPLTPYSNRIINCRMAFEEEVFDIEPPFKTESHQLHGSGWQLPWRVADISENSITLQLNVEKSDYSPYAYQARQVYTLSSSRLMIDMTVKNTSGRRLPFGLGHHPYFNRTPRTILKASLPFVWLSDKIVPTALVPTPPVWDFSSGIVITDEHFGPPRQGVEGYDLMDHCFQAWDGTAEIIYPETKTRIVMQADAHFKQLTDEAISSLQHIGLLNTA